MAARERNNRISLHGVHKRRIQSRKKLLGLSYCLVHSADEFRFDQSTCDLGDGEILLGLLHAARLDAL